MARDGSGNYNLPVNSWNPAANGVSATPVDWQSLINDVAAALTQSLSRDGQTPMSGNLQMGGNKLTGLAVANGNNQALTYGQTGGSLAGLVLTAALTMTAGAVNYAVEVSIVSAATVDLGGAASNQIQITGSTGPITSFGTNFTGPRYVRLASTPTFTNSASLVLPGGANIVGAAGDTFIALPLPTAAGWVVFNYARASGLPIVSATSAQSLTVRNWKADSIGISNYNYVVSADEAVLETSTNLYITQRSISLTINANGTPGAPLAIASGARAASTWYYPWLWYNAGLGLTATLDVSSTAPTAPTGYVSADYKALMPGATRTDASGSTFLLQLKTRNRRSQYVVLSGSNVANLPIMASGILGNTVTPTWSAVAVGNFVPTATAARIQGTVGATGGANQQTILAPNAQYSGLSSSTNPPPVQVNTTNSTHGIPFDFVLEGTNIQYAGNLAAGYLACVGWEDNL